MRPLAALALAAALATPAFADNVTVTVGPHLRQVNGVSQVPIGLFGVHATSLTPAKASHFGIESVRIIDQNPQGKPVLPGTRGIPENIPHIVECFYDRYQPAKVLVDPNWKDNLEKLARTYGENAKTTGFQHIVEFWNEPYLNWATKPGVNYDPAHYVRGNEEMGKPMTLKGHDKPTDYMVWSKRIVAVDKNGNVDYLASAYIPWVYTVDGQPVEQGEKPAAATRAARDGDTFVFRGKKPMTLREMWWGKDTTQRSFYSAKQNSQFYRAMLVPFAKTLKETNPNVELVAGWGCHINMGNWEMWENNYKPVIDDAWQYIDGLHEHHYGGDVRMVPATYETAYAYALGKYGKKLRFYNTEAGGTLDPERPDTPGKPNFEPKTLKEIKGAMTYTVRDIVTLLDICPGKAVARAAHGMHAGDELAFRLLKRLRGNLVETATTDPRLITVASSNPTDGLVTVVLYNDTREEKTAHVTIDVNRSLTSITQWSVVALDDRLDLASKPLPMKQDIAGKAPKWSGQITIPAGDTIVLHAVTEAADAPRPQVVAHTQYVAADVVNRIDKGKSVTLQIAIPPEALKTARGATLQLVHQGLNSRRATLAVNGTPVPADPATGWIARWPLNPAALKANNTVTVTVNPTADAGIIIPAASLILTAAPAETK